MLSLLGGGGAGLVYKARHSLMKKIVAVKVLFPHMVLKQDIVRRFKQEAQAASRLSHANIVCVHDYGISEKGQPYLVMDYLSGMSLADLLADAGTLEFDRAMRIFLQACDALIHAHAKGVVHRDLKPSNFMLVVEDGSEQLKLVDFGLAKAFPEDGQAQTKLTKTGQVFGTPEYMSPEQCRGLSVDNRSDIYSMGCLIYETLSGRSPFSCDDPIETVYAHLSDDPPLLPPAKVPDQFRNRLEVIIWRCMAKDPKDRYQTVEQLKEDLVAVQKMPARFDRLTSLWKINILKLKNFAATPKRAGKFLLGLICLVIGVVGAVSFLLFGPDISGKEDHQEAGWQIANKVIALSPSDIRERLQVSDYFIKGAEDRTGQDSSDTAEAIEKKARFLMNIHKLAEAEPLWSRVWHIRSRIDGPTSETAANSAISLANCYFEQSLYDKAKPLYVSAIKTIEALWGKESELLAIPLSNLSEIYSCEKQWTKAEQGFKQAIKLMQQGQGAEQSADYALAVSRMADMNARAGKLKEAEKYYKIALDCWDQFQGANHQNVIPCLQQLAIVEVKMGNLADAEDYQRREIAVLEKIAGKENPRTGRAIKRLADVLWQRWNIFEALVAKATANRILTGQR